MYEKKNDKKWGKKQLIKLIVAATLTVCLLIALPVTAWFANQRKAAELQKIKYPNTLFINAAYREDQVYFTMDTIDISDVERDWQGNPITTIDSSTGKEVTHVISEKEYVFSVSGSNTDNFDLQLAHTNNNDFTYEIYIATPVSSTSFSTMSPEQKNECIQYQTHPGQNTENTELIITDDLIPDADGILYFQYGAKLQGEAIVNSVAQPINGKYYNQSGTGNLAKNNDHYYSETYGTYTNVQELSVPLYWQAYGLPTSLNADDVANKKDFCRYFIIKVTWDRDTQADHETKESDMVYLSVKRSS